MLTQSVLLIENNKENEAVIIHTLRRSKFEGVVTVARDGPQALDYLFGLGSPLRANKAAFPQLIILELELGKMGGLEVLRRIRDNPRTSRIPVVIFSTSEDQESLIKSYGLGCNAYVRKEADLDIPIETARRLALFWQKNETPPPVENSA
ncbi:MAG: response regulator [Planctomycetota bacterium]